mgnify:FL=1
MDENLKLAIIGIGAGVFGMAVWYAEMFTDSKAANLWRRMNGKGKIGRNYAAVGAPAMACFFFFAGVSGIIRYSHLPRIWLTCSATIVLFTASITLIGLLPINFPNSMYPDWQYAKRHGLLDADGNIDQEAWERHQANKKGLW